MHDLTVNGTFISEKVSKVRWIPEQYTAPDSFVTGSWDFPVNTIKLWKLASRDIMEEENESIPKCIAKVNITGDVTGLEFVDANHIVVSSTDGFVSVQNINRNLARDNLSEVFRYPNLHSFPNDVTASCNAVSSFEHNVATVGEDGRLNVLTTNASTVLRTIDADSCSLTCVSFINHKEVKPLVQIMRQPYTNL